MDREKLIELRAKADAARQCFEGLGLLNAHDRPPDVRVAMDVDYAIARHAWNEAEKKYTLAFDEYIKTKLKD